MDLETMISTTPAAKPANGDFVLKTPASAALPNAKVSVPVQESPPRQTPVSEEELTAAVTSMNEFAQNLQRSLQFSVDEGSGRNVVTVRDSSTEELIRQFPIEEVLAFARMVAEQDADTINLFSSQV